MDSAPGVARVAQCVLPGVDCWAAGVFIACRCVECRPLMPRSSVRATWRRSSRRRRSCRTRIAPTVHAQVRQGSNYGRSGQAVERRLEVRSSGVGQDASASKRCVPPMTRFRCWRRGGLDGQSHPRDQTRERDDVMAYCAACLVNHSRDSVGLSRFGYPWLGWLILRHRSRPSNCKRALATAQRVREAIGSTLDGAPCGGSDSRRLSLVPRIHPRRHRARDRHLRRVPTVAPSAYCRDEHAAVKIGRLRSVARGTLQ